MTVPMEPGLHDTSCVFYRSKKRLFFSDVKCEIVLVNTIYSSKNKYTVKEYSDACKDKVHSGHYMVSQHYSMALSTRPIYYAQKKYLDPI